MTQPRLLVFEPDNVALGHIIKEGRALTANLYRIENSAAFIHLGIINPTKAHIPAVIKIDKILFFIFCRRRILLFEEEHSIYLTIEKFSTIIITHQNRDCKGG